VISSPPGSLHHHTPWYTALGLLALLLFPAAAKTRVALQDDTPPLVAYSIDGITGSNGWYRGSSGGAFIVVHWTVSDPDSPITSTTGCEPAIRIDDPSTGTTRTCSATSDGGTTTITTKLLKVDATPPATTPAPSPAPNANGWLRSPVSVAWNGSDATSGIATCSAASGYSGPDTGGTTVSGSCTDVAGNSSSGSFTLRYDSHAPATTAAPARPPNAAGWYRAPVTITATATDALSGVDSCTSTTYGGPDTTGTSRSVTCTDLAGNSSSDGYLVRYDATPPALSTPSARPPDHDGWYDAPVRIDWHGSDVTSGIASCSSLTYTGPDDPNATPQGSCTDAAGNTSTPLAFGLQYDATPPDVTVTAARPADHDGWYNHAVSIAWSGTDATSGIGSCSAPVTYSGPDSANASSAGGCTDRAGNSASPPPLAFRYDATPPSAQAVAARLPDAGGWYNHRLAVAWSGADAVSGIASCSSYSYSGPDAGTVQPSGDCTDKAGNTSAAAAFAFRYDATPPGAIAAAPARAPDHDGWYNHPVPVRWSGSDALSGVASCTSVTYSGVSVPPSLSGSCTDLAGNTSAPLGVVLKYDQKPPAIERLRLASLDGAVSLRWRVSGAAVVRVTRSPGIGGAATSTVYSGRSPAFADRRVENYVRYRYAVTAVDEAGNEGTRTAHATPRPALFAPRPGARVSTGGAPLLRWRPVPSARYYNVQLWLRGRAVGSWWPSRPRLKLPSRWRFRGEAHRLEPGDYAWYVWPGRGPKRRGHYGPLLGKSTFTV
jgi:hypothetical protein